ncbi:conserved Plasmodium protein, unknown function [Plasmodium malariae]|uniref:Uncharacterized protein n=1 Tax=Plasmodium malariae TaxID=5858 RepID=A0A1C3L1A0_PLAMA|nr:conserved Plasmodium protein, unknown function [Plasmodium malariae]
MNRARFFLLFLLIVLLHKITDTKCSGNGEPSSQDPRLTQTKLESTENNMPSIFSLFSAKPKDVQKNVNFFLEENRNLWLRRTLNNEKSRNMRRTFADFQELRQNDILRFNELMVIQNEQINMLKNVILSIKEIKE